MFLNKLIIIAILAIFDKAAALSTEAATGVNVKSTQKLPSSIPTCKETDAQLNECLKAAFQQLAPRLKEGIPELNIPPLDPYIIEKSVYQFNSGAVQGRVLLRNVHMYGMSDMVVDEVDLKMENGHISLKEIARIPKLYLEGSYKADMKLNELRLTPKGYFNISMTDVTFKSNPEGEIYERDDDHSYLKLTKFDAEPDVGDLRIYASGLFPDPTMNALILDLVNQYWRSLYKDLFSSTRSTWEPIMLDSANQLLSTIPFDLLLTKN